MLKGNSFECHYERMQKKAYSCSRYQISDLITSIQDYIASRSLSNLKRVLPFIRQITYDLQSNSSHIAGKNTLIRRSLKYFSYNILWFSLQIRYHKLCSLETVKIFCKVQDIYLINHISYLSISFFIGNLISQLWFWATLSIAFYICYANLKHSFPNFRWHHLSNTDNNILRTFLCR